MSNALRMPLAEWLEKMAESRLEPNGRVVAIYAAAFDVTGNKQLEMLSGLSERTLDRLKKTLVRDGWVLIGRRDGGRGIGIQVTPAYRETPVTFTDVKQKKGSKHYGGNICKTPADFAGVNDAETPAALAETPAEAAPVSVTPAELTGVISAPSRAEVSNNIYNNINNLTSNSSMSLTEKLAASAREQATIDIGDGVLVNCETIRHAKFEIPLKSIELLTLGNVEMDQIRCISAGIAIDWAKQIAGGKHPDAVLPKNGIANFIARSFHYQKLDREVNDVRKDRARSNSKQVPRPEGKSFSQLNDELIAQFERQDGRK